MTLRDDFASDNTAGAASEALKSLIDANQGFMASYSEDQVTARAGDLIRAMLDADAEVRFVASGTAANALSLAALCRPFEAVLAHEHAHILTNEAGAPGFFGGGLSLIGLIFVGLIVVVLMLLGFKVVPAINEYLAVDRAVQKIRGEGSTVRDIRGAFDRYAQIDDIKSIAGKDLDITKDGDRIVISYSYSYSVPILDNVRLMIDFSGSTRDRPDRAAP